MSRTISNTLSTGITLVSGDNPVTVTGTGGINESSSAYAVYGPAGGSNSWTLSNSGTIIDSNAAAYVVDFGTDPSHQVASGTVTNSGLISSVYKGVFIWGPGTVTNLTGATITSTSGGTNATAVYIHNGTVVNGGRIASADGLAVYLFGAGLSVTNLATGTISGAGFGGVYLYGTGTVTNAGSITGRSSIAGAQGFNNGWGAVSFRTSSSKLIVDPGASFTGLITNGSLAGTTNTVELASAASAGTLAGFNGSSITNFGTLQFDNGADWTVSGTSASSGLGSIAITGFTAGDTIDLTGFSSAGITKTFSGNALTVTNGSALHATLHIQGSFSATNFTTSSDGSTGTDIVFVSSTPTLAYGQTAADEAGVNATSETVAAGILTLSNAGGTVVGTTVNVGTSLSTGDFLVKSDGSGGTDVIVDTVFGTYSSGVTLSVVPTTIASSGSIHASAGAALTGAGGAHSWTVTNAGTISASVTGHTGVQIGLPATFASTSFFTNQSGGLVSSDDFGVAFDAPGTVVNQAGGSIVTTNTVGSNAVYVSSATLVNGGVIRGGAGGFGSAVYSTGGGPVTNLSTGTITGGAGGVFFQNTFGTLTNAGTIISTGTYGAVQFNDPTAGNRLIVDPGAVFSGKVLTSYASQNVVELASAASAGTLAGFNGSSITNFGTLQFDNGADWTVSGTSAASGLGTIAITGFTLGDTIDLTGFSSSGITDTFAANALTLTNGSTLHATLHIQGSFSATNFSTSSDGSTGTDVFISNTPTLAYGQTAADEAGVNATSETVAAGILTLSNAGGTVVGTTVNVGTSLSTGEFLLKSDGAGGTDVVVDTVFGTYTSGVTLLTNPTTIASTGKATNTAASGNAVSGPTGTAWTVTNLGTVAESGATTPVGISLAASGTVINAGSISATTTASNGVGVSLAAGGAVTNQAGGAISGPFGVQAAAASATVVNAGTITGTTTAVARAGVKLSAGGSVTNQSGGTISGFYGVWGQTSPISVANQGAIIGNQGSSLGVGVYLAAGGTLTNGAAGSIIGGNAVYVRGAAGTIQNAGTLTGNATNASNAGVYLKVAGSSLTNQSGGTITGFRGAAALGSTVVNAGSLVGNATSASGAGVLLTTAGVLTNQSGGTITGFLGVYNSSGAATVVNAGVIAGNTSTGKGISLKGAGTLTNLAGGSISGGADAVQFAAGVTNRLVIDPGATFTGTVNGGNTIGAASISTLELASTGSTGTLTGLGSQYVNFARGIIDTHAQWVLNGSNTAANGVTLTDNGTLTVVGTLVNAGSIVGDYSAIAVGTGGQLTNQSGGTITNANPLGIIVTGAGTVVNAGLVQVGTAGGQKAVSFGAGGVITNQSGGTIIGNTGVYANTVAATVVNAGAILSPASVTSGNGIVLDAGGLVSDTSGGSITGYTGVYITGAAGTVINAGGITAGTGSLAYGVKLGGGGSVTNQSGGTISGYFGIGAVVASATVTNLGSISGAGASGAGVYLEHGGTVTNAGTISGTGNAVRFAAGFTNRLVIDPGAVFSGGVVNGGNTIGGTSISAIELASAASAGTLTGFGSRYLNFEQINFDAGSQWDVIGSDATSALAGATITGFSYGDTIDVTNFVVTSSSFSSNHLTLSSGASTITLDVAGSFVTSQFSISSDGTTGSNIILQPPARHYGDTIDEAGIVAASETVSAGVMTLFNAGSTAVGTVHVGTSLSAGDFILRSDGAGGTDVIVNTVFGTYTSGVTLLTNPTTIAATGNVANTAASGAAVSGPTGTNWTLVNNGLVSETASVGVGVSVAQSGTITNASGGTIVGTSFGIAFSSTASSGTVTNQSSGVINGASNAVYFLAGSGAGTVTNFGTIATTGTTAFAGVDLSGGGVVSNASGGTITGRFIGIQIRNGTGGTVSNAGSIGATVYDGVWLVNGGTVTNASGGTVTGAYSTNAAGIYLQGGGSVTNQSGGLIGGLRGIYALTVAATVLNSGQINGTGTTIGAATAVAYGGVYLGAGGSVTNNAGGSVSGYAGVNVKGAAATVVNAGLITGNQTANHAYGVTLAAGGSVTNQSGGTITGYYGIFANNTAATVVNAGRIAGNYTAGNAVGISFAAGGSVTNQSGGTISGHNDGVRISGASGTVDNLGRIQPNDIPGQAGQYGVYLADGGTITNGASGGTVSSAYILGYNRSVQFGASGTDTLINFGTVSGNPGGQAVRMTTGVLINGPSGATGALIEGGLQTSGVGISGAATVVNYGTILGIEETSDTGVYYGVSLGGAGSISNLGSHSLIESYLPIYAAFNATVTNAGTLDAQIGGNPASCALMFGGGTNRLIVDPGAVFLGNVSGSGPVTLSPSGSTQVFGTIAATAHGAAVSTLELASAASAGMLAGFGTSITNFASLVFDTGAQWTVAGNDSASGLGTLGITGFTFGDTIDLTGFAAVSRTFASNSLVLTDGGGAHATLAVQGSFATGNFRITNDGGGGTDISLQPILIYGQTVDEAGIVAATETVTNGVMILRNGGGTAVGTVTVGDSLSTGDFVLTSDGAGGTDVIVKTVFGTYATGVTLSVNPTTIASSATVQVAAGNAVYAPGGASANWTVDNFGLVTSTTGQYGIEFGTGVNLVETAFLTNHAGGTISGADGIGVNANSVVSFVNLAGGTIIATGATNRYGVAVVQGVGTVSNAGLIQATTTDASDIGVELVTSFTLVNLAGGTIAGGEGVYGVSGVTVVNAGTISGLATNAFAVTLQSGGRVIADPGAVFVGAVAGGGGELELASAASAGTLTATNFTNFSTIAFDAGAAWTLAAATTALAGSIVGFTFGDTIDLTGFAAASRTFAGNSLVLTDGGGAHATLAVQGSFRSGNFVLAADGSGGTEISLQPDVLYADTIDEAGIVAASETVAAGVMTLRNGGGTAVGTINVGTSLSTGDFSLQTDGAGGTDVVVHTAIGTYASALTLLVNPTTIASFATVTNAAASGAAVIGPSGTAWTLTNLGSIAETGSSSGIGISFAASGTIINSGSVSGNATAAGAAGVSLAAGGSVTNQSGGTLSGRQGVSATGAAAVVNAGSIGGNGTILATGGVVLSSGGTVTNQSGGRISGFYGVWGLSAAISVVNQGSVTGNTANSHAAGLYLGAGGSVTNAAGALVTGYNAIYAKSAATVVNAGSIGGNPSTGKGVYLTAGGTITNQSGGAVSGGADAVLFAASFTNRLVVDPGATFNGTVDGGNTIGAAHTSTLELASGASAGTLSGLGSTYIHFAGVTIDANANWTFSGTNTLATGATLGNGGTLTDIGALIIAGTLSGNKLRLSGASLTNQSGGLLSATYIQGVSAGGADTVVNQGSITNSANGAIYLQGTGSVTNAAGALIEGVGGVTIHTDGTVINAGTIASSQGTTGVAVAFIGGNARLIDDPGAVFTGSVSGGGGTAELELASGSSAGVVSGVGTGITNFSSLVFDSGAQWTASGNDSASGLGTLGISGFTIGDTIDLTGFVAASRTFASNTLVLTSAGNAHDTLHVQGAFSTGNFEILADGTGGTDVIFQSPPTITAGSTVSFTGGGGPVTLDSALTVADPGYTTLTGGSVSIGSGFLTGDVLNFTNAAGITGGYNAANGTLTLSGTASLADYQAALESISYSFSPSDGDPTGGGGDTSRTIDWVLNNGAVSNTAITSTLNVVHVAPTITAGGTVTFSGGGSAVTLDSTLALSDPDSGGLLNGGTVSIGGFVSGDILSANTTGLPSISVAYNSSTGVLTLSGSDTLADYLAVLRSVAFSFNPANGDPTDGGGDTTRTFGWVVSDGSSSNGISNAGSSTLDAVHAAPTIAAGGTVAFAAGGPAAVLDAGLTVADVDSAGDIAGAAIAIGSGFLSGDTLHFTNQNGITGSFNSTTGTLTLSGAASIADYQTALESVSYSFTPNSGDPTDSQTDNLRTISWSVTDGVSSSTAATSTLHVTRIPPAIAGTVGGQTTTDEASLDPFSGVTITDPNSGQTETVTVTLSSPANGTLSDLSGGTVNAGTYVVTGTTLAVTAALDDLVFTPTAHQVAPGSTVTSGFTITALDSNGVSATDTTTTVIATALNDAPVIAGSVAGQTVTDEATVSPFTGVSISDVDFGQTETVTVTLSNHLNGALSNLGTGSYNGSTGVYSVTGTDSNVTAAVEALVFTPTAHQVAPNSSVTTTFTIQATDTAGGTSSNSTTTVAATAVNDAPVIAGSVAGQTVTDETTVSPFTGVSVSDVDFGQSETVTVTLSNHLNGALSNLGTGSYNASTGVYSVTGTDSAVTAAVEALVFTPTAHQVAPNSSVTTTFTIHATDTAGATASNAATSVTATASTDLPVVTGTAPSQATSDETPVTPFSAVTISNPDFGQTETATITLSSTANGTLSNLGTGSYNAGTGTYTVTGTDAQVTAALDALTFTPTPHQVPPGSTATTVFTLGVTDTAGATTSGITSTLTTTAANDPPVITGTTAGQTATDETTITPFSAVTIQDPDIGQTETVTVTLSAAANGTLSSTVGGSYTAGTGVFTVTGTDAQVTAALDALVFTPTPHQVAPGSVVTTGFTIKARDTAGATASESVTTVLATAVNDPPSIILPPVNAGVPNQTGANPFAGVSIVDPDIGHINTVTVTLSNAAGGVLSNLGGGSYDPAAGVYTLSGSAADLTAALQGLVFTPAPPPANAFTSTTSFTVAVTGPGGSASNNSIAVTSAQQVLGLAATATADDIVSASADGTSFAPPVADKSNQAVITTPTDNTTYTLPTGYQAAFLGGSANATLTDTAGGNALLVANTGNDILVSGATSDTILGSAGLSQIEFMPSASGGLGIGGSGGVMFLDSGHNDTLSGGSGTTTATTAGSGAMFFAQDSDASVVNSGSGNTLVGGSFQSMFQLTPDATGSAVFGGSGSVTITNAGGNNTLAGAAGATAVTTSGANTVFFGQAGAVTLMTSGAGGILVGGSSSSSFQLTGSATGTELFGGSGTATIADAGSNNSIAGAAGATAVTTAGSTSLFFGEAGAVSLVDTGTANTIVGGSGAIAATSSGAGALLFGGSGTLSFVGGTAGATVMGGSGDATVTGGSGGTTLFGSSGGTIDYLGDTGSLLYAARNGNETLNAAGSTTSNQLFGALDPNGRDLMIGGSGNDTIAAGSGSDTLTGGSGSDLFVFFIADGGVAANDMVVNFSPSDRVLLAGYGPGAATAALSQASSAGGSTTITLSDNTRITFSDVSSVSALNGHVLSN